MPAGAGLGYGGRSAVELFTEAVLANDYTEFLAMRAYAQLLKLGRSST